MPIDRVEHILSRVRTLPALPAVVYKLLKLVELPTSTATDLSDVISKDQALTARILRLVNSSFYALRCEVVKVSHAIALLGFVAIKNLALGLGVIDMFGRGREGGELNGPAFWEHSLSCATAARLIAERVRFAPAEEAFVAGLLHDIGKLVLHDHFRAEFDAALRVAREEAMALPAAERLVFKTDHAVVGEALAAHWRLPQALRASIGSHHHVSDHDRLSNIVHAANFISNVKRLGSGGDVALEPVDEALWSVLGLNEASVIRLQSQLVPEVNKARVFLGLSNVPQRDPSDEVERDLTPSRRILIIEEHLHVVSPIELLLLDEGHTTARTTDPESPDAAAADIVLLDFTPNGLDRGQAVAAQIEQRVGVQRPVILLPAPRRSSDVLDAVHSAVSKALV
ncbi:MAG: HDOD domain-containing protein [Verrucomicrobia bacterium]|nr:HDOD domain-containing protein [Verrucomicrobiota bacterium]